VPAADYTVVARSATSECSTVVRFGASVPPPVELDYPSFPEEMAVGYSVCFEPELKDGIPTEFKVTPALPEGLSIDRATGCIRGAATVETEKVRYVVTALNPGGQASATIVFSVRSTVPKALSYPGILEAYTNATMISLAPKVVGGTPDSFAVEPELPEGLVFCTISGEINGMPTMPCERGTWRVFARNAAGECSAEISFAVTRAPPSALAYPSLALIYAAGRAVRLDPSLEGEAEEFVVTPALPSGLVLDPATGIISGTSPSAVAECDYEVVAKNEVGSTSTRLRFAINVLPPSGLTYPSADDVYTMGEAVLWTPQLEGGANRFSVEPALPKGLELDEVSGIVSGSPEEVAERCDYTFTVSNEGGETSTTVSFRVEPSAPQELEYPSLGEMLFIGEAVDADPEINPGSYTFEVEPALPEGLVLDPRTGRIEGSPVSESELATYVVKASNISGSAEAELQLSVTAPPVEAAIDLKFAQVIENITEVTELLEREPPKNVRSGDWMIWMVHRAFLDDPMLTDFNFNHCKMPLPHEEWRVAPKLMKALESNTHIECLSLVKTNLQKPQGHELAKALSENCTLKVVNIESNHLDSSCMQRIAEGIAANPNTQLQQLRLSFQIGMGRFYGRPVEKAFGEMMQKNETITRLGFAVDDRHWMNTINGYLTRNADFARRRRKNRNMNKVPTGLPVEIRTLARLHLQDRPSTLISETLTEGGAHASVFSDYLVQNRMMPNPSQLQSFASNAGRALKFSELKPTIEQCRSQLLRAAVGSGVTVVDTFNSNIRGKLSKTLVQGSRWTVDLISDDKIFRCEASKEPGIAVSASFAHWIEGKAGEEDEEQEE